MFEMSPRRRWPSGEKGQTMVLVAVALLALLGAGAMAVDMGQLLWSRGAEQNIADAAALAGVRDLPDDPPGAVALATDYAKRNYPSGEPITVNAHVKNEAAAAGGNTTVLNAIVVEVHRTFQPGLRAAVGGGPIDVPADAEAVVTAAMPPCKYFPLAIPETVLPVGFTTPISYSDLLGYEVTLKVGAQNNYTPGNFGALDLSGSGGDNYRQNLAAGGACISPPPVPGSWLDTLPGNKVGPTQQGVNDLLNFTNPQPPSWSTLCASGLVQCTNGVPDNVYWDTSGLLDPPSPPPPPLVSPPAPWGLGSPSSPPNPPSGCTGDPSDLSTNPSVYATYPQVSYTCPRVVFIPIIPNSGPGSYTNGSSQVQVLNWAAFYVIGSPDPSTLQGSFLSKVVVTDATPTWQDPSNSAIVGYFLWR